MTLRKHVRLQPGIDPDSLDDVWPRCVPGERVGLYETYLPTFRELYAPLQSIRLWEIRPAEGVLGADGGTLPASPWQRTWNNAVTIFHGDYLIESAEEVDLGWNVSLRDAGSRGPFISRLKARS